MYAMPPCIWCVFEELIEYILFMTSYSPILAYPPKSIGWLDPVEASLLCEGRQKYRSGCCGCGPWQTLLVVMPIRSQQFFLTTKMWLSLLGQLGIDAERLLKRPAVSSQRVFVQSVMKPCSEQNHISCRFKPLQANPSKAYGFRYINRYIKSYISLTLHVCPGPPPKSLTIRA